MSIATPVDRVTRFEQIFVPHTSHSIDAGLQSSTKANFKLSHSATGDRIATSGCSAGQTSWCSLVAICSAVEV
jgi:hypothetical protein